MNYDIKRNNNPVASVRPEGQLQTSVMGEELVTMTFSLSEYVHFQMGDTVEVYGNMYYLATEPKVEKISSREFRYSLEFQGIKYELAKVQYLFPDAQNVLNLSDFHIMGTARQMLDLLVQNANRIGQGWSLGSIDQTETKQLNFSAENCLAVLAKIAQEFKLEYWVDGDKSIHLTERKAISGYTFEYGKAKGLKSLTRQTYNNSNIVTRLYAFGSEKNIAGNYRGGQQKLRMNVPYLEKNTNIYGVIEGSQTFDVYPHRLGTVTAVNPSNPLQFTDSGMDFDLNARENGNTKYLINGVPVKVTFNTGQLAGYTFEVKEFGYNTATKTFTLLKNQDEKAIEVPSETLRPAVGDKYVLTDLIMPESYITNAEAELQQKAQEYLNENSRQRVIYSLVTDPFYFEAQNVNIALGSTIRAIDADFNLDENLRVVKLSKDLQNPFNVQLEVAERAEIAYIVREYLEAEKERKALFQADKQSAEMARRAYRFGREISENVFDGEGYFNAEKIKPLSIETKLLSVGSRMQQFTLPDVIISMENTTTMRNTRGKIVHLTLEEEPREWLIPANTQVGISTGFNYVYIKAQRNGTNASVLVSPEKIGVESNADFYHFEAGYLGSVENGQRRLRMSHGFTQINPFEITTGRIAPPSGNHYIALEQDRIRFVGDVTFSSGSPALQQVSQISQQQVTASENALRAYADAQDLLQKSLLQAHADGKVSEAEQRQIANAEAKLQEAKNHANNAVSNVHIGSRNHVLKSRITMSTSGILAGGTKSEVTDALFGNVVRYDRPNGGGDFQFAFSVVNRPYLNSKDLIYMVIAKPLGTGVNSFNFGLWQHTFNSVNQSSSKKDLGNGWFCYWSKVNKIDVGQGGLIGINSVRGSWLFYAVGIFESTNYVDWSPAPEDITAEASQLIAQSTAQSKLAWEAYATAQANGASATALATAKAYAEAKDNEKETLVKAYADGKITTAEQNAINVATAKANLAESLAKSHADSRVTAEEQRAIADAQAKYNQAVQHANQAVSNVQIGGRNFLLNSNTFKTGYSATGVVMNLLADNSLKIVVGSNASGDAFVTSFWLNKSFERVVENIKEGDVFTISLNIRGENINNSLAPTIFINPSIGGYQRMEGSVTNRFTQVFKTFTYKSTQWNVHLGFRGCVGTYYISNWKLEKGNKATDWSPAPEDVESQITAVQTVANQALGLTQAQTANITGLQSKTNFLTETSVNGNAIATGSMILGNGYGANSGVTGLGGTASAFLWGGTNFTNRENAPISLHRDGFMRVRDSQGRVIFEIGQKDGKAVFNIYNESGTLVAKIGNQGIMFTGYVPESYNTHKLEKLTSNYASNSLLINEIKTKFRKQLIAQAQPSTQDNNWQQYDVRVACNTTAYTYNSGRNFESAGNSQYEGIYFTHQNKLGNRIPDGVYAGENRIPVLTGQYQSGEAFVPPNGAGYYTGDFTMSVEIYAISGGKITSVKTLNVEYNVGVVSNG